MKIRVALQFGSVWAPPMKSWQRTPWMRQCHKVSLFFSWGLSVLPFHNSRDGRHTDGIGRTKILWIEDPLKLAPQCRLRYKSYAGNEARSTNFSLSREPNIRMRISWIFKIRRLSIPNGGMAAADLCPSRYWYQRSRSVAHDMGSDGGGGRDHRKNPVRWSYAFQSIKQGNLTKQSISALRKRICSWNEEPKSKVQQDAIAVRLVCFVQVFGKESPGFTGIQKSGNSFSAKADNPSNINWESNFWVANRVSERGNWMILGDKGFSKAQSAHPKTVDWSKRLDL